MSALGGARRFVLGCGTQQLELWRHSVRRRSSRSPSAPELITGLRLAPLPGEGGYYRETWRSAASIPEAALGDRYRGGRAFGSAILYLLTDDADSFSALHRLPTDEVYHFYLGDRVEMLLLNPGGASEIVVLGPDVLHGERVQHVVPRGAWQGSSLAAGGKWALLGTTMAPGFEFADYEPGDRAELTAGWPDRADRIRKLTREAGGRPVRDRAP